ncbi:MAG: lysine--tRNA ligase [Actinobacteria bacterium]|nr:lysine--tRNA ligase [Actinomycetota bacterium]
MTDETVDPTEETSRLDELVADRRRKVAEMRERGEEPYPVRFTPTQTLEEVQRRWGELEPGEETGEIVTVAGRLMSKREFGKLAFGVLREDGTDVQLFCQVQVLGEDGMARFVDELDPGDWVGATGEVVATKKGELSVRPVELTILGKALRPPPDKWHGLRDVEQRYRQRETDLTVNLESRRVFEVRSRVLRALRDEMRDRGYVEVETPMLHPIPGGATARPFVTHHNTLDLDLYLRIAPELYLKRLIVGGFRRVFEINRNFRNEGMSPRHNPEFTMLESYEAYADYHDVMELTEALIERAAEEAVGSLEVTYQDRSVSLQGPYPRRPLLELVQEALDDDTVDYGTPTEELRAIAREHDIDVQQAWGVGKLIMELYEELVEPHLWDPVFVIDHPLETSPLARRHRDEDHVVERFELVVTGRELANAFSELTDPDDQRRRFEEQARAKAAGDEEAMVVDEAYLTALEQGMPPAGGLGVGVDRLVMLLADVPTIRDVILFPTLRPERPDPPETH